VSGERYVHAWLLSLDPAWRRLSAREREADVKALCSAADSAARRVTQHSYSTIGLRTEGDILLWRMADTIDDLEQSAAALLSAGIGRWLTPHISLIGITRPSQYVKRPTGQEQSLFEGERSRYLIVYPFSKSVEWYLTPAEDRQKVMAGHMKVGHRYPQVRQLLAHSFGVDDQEFIVAYETDDLVAFQDLVREMRETESRRATTRDTPIITGIHRPLGDILGMLSGRSLAAARGR
jgi:chlorite dismutase